MVSERVSERACVACVCLLGRGKGENGIFKEVTPFQSLANLVIMLIQLF